MRTLKEFIANFRRFKMAGVLNVVGLSVAFTAFAVIAIQLVFELRYDKFHKNADTIFRVEPLYPMSSEYTAMGPDPLGGLLKESCPQIKDYFYMSDFGTNIFRLTNDNQGDKFQESFTYASASFADVLGLTIVEGDGKQALTEPRMLLIPESISRKWFPQGGAVGKQVYEKMGGSYVISAVYKDFPDNSIFTNSCYTRYEETGSWSNWNGHTFVLSSTPNRGALNEAVSKIKMEMFDQIFESLNKKEEIKKEGKAYVRVSPLIDIYYDSTVIYDTLKKGSKRSAFILLGVGILIMVIAGINFVNFSMSLAPARMKGVNTQKVLGATAGTLRRKLIGEAIMYSVLAFFVSLGGLYVVSSTGLSHLFSMSLSPLDNLPLLGVIGCVSILLGALAGMYPAFYITSFEPAMVLKGSFVLTPKGIRLRNGLMAFQFIISMVLIMCTLLMTAQNRFMLNYSPGYRTENIGVLELEHTSQLDYKAIAGEMRNVPGVEDCTFGDNTPGSDFCSATGNTIDGEAVRLDFWHVDRNFMSFFEIPLVDGSSFSDNGKQVILNETALKRYPVLAKYMGRPISAGLDSCVYVGTAKDINYLSLRSPVNALAIISVDNEPYPRIFLKLAGANMTETLNGVRKVYDKFMPGGMFEFAFLDASLQKQYEAEERSTLVISLLGGIAIVLALVGVYGLVVFNAQYKRKEIGIRKVNGATEGQIMVLLNRSFFRLLLFAFVVACPLAWYAISRWLEGFSYKTAIHWWIFLLAGVITLLIVLLTVSWQSWRAATANPVESLKSE